VNFAAFDKLVDERADRWTKELADFCSIPCETAHPDELRAGAKWTAERLRAAGCRVETIELPGVPPLVVGGIGAGPKTVVAVQHYDVQPAAPLELWTTPPFAPTVRDGRLYARGVNDDKGQFLIRVQAIEAYREAFGELPCKVRFLVEGEEESGSRHFGEMLDKRPELVAGDAALAEGGGVDAKERPSLWCGVRGMIYVELGVRTLKYDAHSGGASLLENAAWRLVDALSTLRRGDGRVLIDGFYDDVRKPTTEQLEQMRAVPFEEEALKRVYDVKSFVGGRTGFDAHVAQIFEPTCNIAGIWSGWQGPDAKTITPAEARVKIDMRLVPDQDPAKIQAALRAHLDRRGFTDITITSYGGEHPYWTPVTHPVVDAAAKASADVFGKPALRVLAVAGTAPMYQVCARGKLGMVGIGGGHMDSRIHAPDENLRLDLQWKAAKVVGRFFAEYAAS
jgi:acetylornithine deacetylase/succinyl-diaminopimelate desuccinylase-like protein